MAFEGENAKFNFGWGSDPDPAPRAIALPRPPSWISGVSLEGTGSKGRERGNKSPEWLSQKLGTTANAAVNSETALNLIR